MIKDYTTLQEAVARAITRAKLGRLTPDIQDVIKEQALDATTDEIWAEHQPEANAAISTTLKWMEENVSEEMLKAGMMCAGIDLKSEFIAMVSAMRKGMEG